MLQEFVGALYPEHSPHHKHLVDQVVNPTSMVNITNSPPVDCREDVEFRKPPKFNHCNALHICAYYGKLDELDFLLGYETCRRKQADPIGRTPAQLFFMRIGNITPKGRQLFQKHVKFRHQDRLGRSASYFLPNLGRGHTDYCGRKYQGAKLEITRETRALSQLAQYEMTGDVYRMMLQFFAEEQQTDITNIRIVRSLPDLRQLLQILPHGNHTIIFNAHGMHANSVIYFSIQAKQAFCYVLSPNQTLEEDEQFVALISQSLKINLQVKESKETPFILLNKIPFFNIPYILPILSVFLGAELARLSAEYIASLKETNIGCAEGVAVFAAAPCPELFYYGHDPSQLKKLFPNHPEIKAILKTQVALAGNDKLNFMAFNAMQTMQSTLTQKGVNFAKTDCFAVELIAKQRSPILVDCSFHMSAKHIVLDTFGNMLLKNWILEYDELSTCCDMIDNRYAIKANKITEFCQHLRNIINDAQNADIHPPFLLCALTIAQAITDVHNKICEKVATSFFAGFWQDVKESLSADSKDKQKTNGLMNS